MSKIDDKLKNNKSDFKFNFKSSVKSTETIYIPIQTQNTLLKKIEQNRKEISLSRHNIDSDRYKQNITNIKKLTLHR